LHYSGHAGGFAGVAASQAEQAMALTAKRIEQLRKTPGRYIDGGDLGRGLYLQVTDGGASWLLRYERGDRERWMGLGALADFSLKEARARAKAKRQLLADGIDPLDQKKADKAARALAATKAITFSEAAQAYFDQHAKKWSNKKHRAQFLSTLTEYAFPKIGTLPVANIDTGQVLRVLEQKHKDYPDQRVWEAIPETASRVRGRIEAVLDWCTTRSFRSGDNPARWEGHLDNVLPARSDIQKVKHHPALAYAEVPAFMAALRERKGIAAQALEFLILCAARTGAVTGATRNEIDFEAKIWTVPPERAGAKIIANDDNPKPRRIPLCDRAIEILKALPQEHENPHLFIGGKEGHGLSNMAMAELMKDLAFPSTTPGRIATAHGFRSTFKDWVSETTNYPNHVSEAALWHAVADKVEAAYRRGDLFAKRRRLMAEWAKYCGSPPVTKSAKIVPLHKAGV
jgi:integrase